MSSSFANSLISGGLLNGADDEQVKKSRKSRKSSSSKDHKEEKSSKKRSSSRKRDGDDKHKSKKSGDDRKKKSKKSSSAEKKKRSSKKSSSSRKVKIGSSGPIGQMINLSTGLVSDKQAVEKTRSSSAVPSKSGKRRDVVRKSGGKSGHKKVEDKKSASPSSNKSSIQKKKDSVKSGLLNDLNFFQIPAFCSRCCGVSSDCGCKAPPISVNDGSVSCGCLLMFSALYGFWFDPLLPLIPFLTNFDENNNLVLTANTAGGFTFQDLMDAFGFNQTFDPVLHTRVTRVHDAVAIANLPTAAFNTYYEICSITSTSYVLKPLKFANDCHSISPAIGDYVRIRNGLSKGIYIIATLTDCTDLWTWTRTIWDAVTSYAIMHVAPCVVDWCDSESSSSSCESSSSSCSSSSSSSSCSTSSSSSCSSSSSSSSCSSSSSSESCSSRSRSSSCSSSSSSC